MNKESILFIFQSWNKYLMHFEKHIFAIQFKTQEVVIPFENYCEKTLISDRGKILTLEDNSISPGFFELTLYPKTSHFN